MSEYRYPVKELVSDYIRAGSGVFVPLGLILFTDLLPLVTYIMVALILLFGIYGLRTMLRQATVITIDDIGARQEGPLGAIYDRRIRWSDMRDFRLRYYSTRRDGKGGWMQLLLRCRDGSDSRGPIRIDSILSDFEEIVHQAHDSAQERGLSIDPTSATNLASLGIGDGDPAARPPDHPPDHPADPVLPS